MDFYLKVMTNKLNHIINQLKLFPIKQILKNNKVKMKILINCITMIRLTVVTSYCLILIFNQLHKVVIYNNNYQISLLQILLNRD